jgi:hypothetical protein
MAVFNGASGIDSFIAPPEANTIDGSTGADTVSFIIGTPSTRLTPAGAAVFRLNLQIRTSMT